MKREYIDNPVELQLKSDKPIKLVKVPGSYGTYQVKEISLTIGEKVIATVFVTTILVLLLA